MRTKDQDRITSAAAVIALHALLAWAFLSGLVARVAAPVDKAFKVFDIAAPEPPPPETKPASTHTATPEQEGRAAPPAPKATASPIVAPKPKIALDPPPPIIAAPTPDAGAQVSQGASDRAGPGTGAGGFGTGIGSGGQGAGTGGGDATARARQVSGRIVNADYPRAARRAGAEGEVLVHFTVEPSGRVGPCKVMRSSGNGDLDATTCRLIQQRYRFEPARDASGRAVRDEKGWVQRWWLERD